MSRIYFHSPSQTTEVSGSERSYFGGLITDLLLVSIDRDGLRYDCGDHWLRKVLPKSADYVHAAIGNHFADAVDTWLGRTSDRYLFINDKPYSTFELALNTALISGSPAIKLAARIAGQCEIHCFVEGKDRIWLASIITEARRTGVYRAGMGWEETISMLTSNRTEPVVLSYSVCRQFPNYEVLSPAQCATLPKWKPDPDWPDYRPDGQELLGERWEQLPGKKQWTMAMKALRANSTMRIQPDTFHNYHFGHGMNGFQLQEIIHRAK